MLQDLDGCESAHDVARITSKDGKRLHGQREPGDLTHVGKAVFAHTGLKDDVLAGSLFRFWVTPKARMWALLGEAGEFEVLFWDPHHYLGNGHNYNRLPWRPNWLELPEGGVG